MQVAVTEHDLITLSEIEQAIDDLGQNTPEYHEAVAFFCTMLARAQWRQADHIRSARMRQQRRSPRTHADDDDPAAGEV